MKELGFKPRLTPDSNHEAFLALCPWTRIGSGRGYLGWTSWPSSELEGSRGWDGTDCIKIQTSQPAPPHLCPSALLLSNPPTQFRLMASVCSPTLGNAACSVLHLTFGPRCGGWPYPALHPTFPALGTLGSINSPSPQPGADGHWDESEARAQALSVRPYVAPLAARMGLPRIPFLLCLAASWWPMLKPLLLILLGEVCSCKREHYVLLSQKCLQNTPGVVLD